MTEETFEGNDIIVINGKRVRLHTRFPAKDNWDLPEKLMMFQTSQASQSEPAGEPDAAGNRPPTMDMKIFVPILPRLVAGWEFPWDPAEEDSYGELDMFRELIPLVQGAMSNLVGLMGDLGSGEAESGPISV